jgi:hypothetical protein
VNDPALMRCCQSASNLCRDCRRSARNEWSNASQHGGEIFSINKFHDDRWRIALGGHVKHGGNVWVRNDRCGAALCAESRGGIRRCGECATEHLHRYISTEHFVGGTENRGCSAFTDLFLKSVSSRNQIARLEANL